MQQEDNSNICPEVKTQMDDLLFIPNNVAVSMASWYNKQMGAVSARIAKLEQIITDDNYKQVIHHAGKFAARKPTIHLETGILNRLIKTKWFKFLQHFEQPKPEDFDFQLEKAEKQMFKPSVFKGSKRRLMRATYRASLACKFPNNKFTPASIYDATYTQLNKRASSGYPKFQRKGTLLDELAHQASDIFSTGNVMDIFNWPMTRGFRIQFRESMEKVNLKIRVMYPYPAIITLLEVIFIIPFVKHFINTDTFYVIGSNGLTISQRMRRKLKGKDIDKILATDISSFDQNMTNEAIIMAFWIIRNQLDLNKIESKIFDHIVVYFCTSIMVSKSKGKPAYAFVKTHGVPSGSGYTNMIDTLAHAIVLEYCSMGILERSLICGDDNIIAIKSLDVNLLFQIFENCFNLPINKEKTKIFNSSLDVEFLGFRWINFIRMVSPRLVVNQTCYHTDFRTDLDQFDREVSRSASVLLNGFNGKLIFFDLFPELKKLLELGIDVRFIYLYGSQPPSKLAGVIGLQEHEAARGFNESLSLHIREGWAIR